MIRLFDYRLVRRFAVFVWIALAVFLHFVTPVVADYNLDLVRIFMAACLSTGASLALIRLRLLGARRVLPLRSAILAAIWVGAFMFAIGFFRLGITTTAPATPSAIAAYSWFVPGAVIFFFAGLLLFETLGKPDRNPKVWMFPFFCRKVEYPEDLTGHARLIEEEIRRRAAFVAQFTYDIENRLINSMVKNGVPEEIVDRHRVALMKRKRIETNMRRAFMDGRSGESDMDEGMYT